MRTITLYTKPGCHLCESVEQVITQVRRRVPFSLVIRNILENPQDLEAYGVLIPVVLIDGHEIARYRLTEGQLIAALQGNSAGV